ncbi:zinc finger protein ZAT4-like [Papaver somniferum]|uniref:zinc finger protein ZAT4-like n=1 Tax=Papaver somniferum TaxID=3469 RepID=UPI000E6FF90E|nr:zinc finger protein ZAT4-like [Papaver somniferum]
MTTIVDHHHQQQQPVFKHHCKVCKKGFGCGRALGGHMRAHGIGEDHGNIEDEEDEEEDEDVESDWEERIEGKNKRMYALRTNTNQHKNCRTCENCGKEFLSWKSFLEHGKCSSADAESLVSSRGSDDEDIDAEDGITPRGYGWSKGKRTRRSVVNNKLVGNSPYIPSHCPSTEEEDLANCLVMLSNAAHEKIVEPLAIVAETEESCASAIREDEERRKPVAFLGGGGTTRAITFNTNTNNNYNRVSNFDQKSGKNVSFTNIKGMFECKACKKVFSSHQALGGHRASHKKVKGCFASKIDNVLDESVVMEEDVITNEDFNVPTKSTTQPLVNSLDQNYNHQPFSYKKKSKVHECSICHRIFSSGQALGGHKRCHWLNSSSSTETSSIINKLHPHQFQIYNHHHLQTQPTRFISSNEPTLDLNLPAPIDEYNIIGTRGESRPRLSFEMSTDMYLQPWIQSSDDDNNKYSSNNCATTLVNNNSNAQDKDVDAAEDGNKLKLAKLSELKDMHIGGGGGAGGTFSWLQVGIGSPTNNVGSNP